MFDRLSMLEQLGLIPAPSHNDRVVSENWSSVVLLVRARRIHNAVGNFGWGIVQSQSRHLLSSSGGMVWTDGLRPEQKLARYTENAEHQEQLPAA
jgi:hypothetical protein